MTMTRTSGSIAVVTATPSIAMGLYAPSVPGAYGRPDLQMALLGKRLLDIVLSVMLLILSLPLLAGAALAIRLTSRGPLIFTQRRIGLRGAEFEMYKLRTMCTAAEDEEETLAAEQPGRIFFKRTADPRVTAVGRWLRKYSIDEIPQFLNVLRGDMSLVGPRPLLACDWKNFPRDHHRRRIWMRPGVTGLWQVKGRSLCSDEERMRLDLDYVDHWTLTLDLEILLRTPGAVVSAQGAW